MKANTQLSRDQLVCSTQLKINLLNIEKKLMHRDKYVVEIITDNRIDQVKKTYREFEYFNKLISQKNLSKQISLNKSIRSSNRNKSLEKYIQKLNSGVLTLKNSHGNEQIIRENLKIKEIRTHLYTLLFQSDALFVDGIDDSSEDQIFQQKKQKQTVLKMTDSRILPASKRNDQKPLIQRQKQKNTIEIATKKEKEKCSGIPGVIQKKQQIKKDIQQNYLNLGKNLMSMLKSKKKPVNFQLSQNSSIKNILKNIKHCYLKCTNNFKNRDRSKFYVSHRWVLYDFKFHDCALQFMNLDHRRIILLHSFEIQLSFQDYTKIIIKNKIDNMPIQIRLQEIESEQTHQTYEKYLALYTFLKQMSTKFTGLRVVNKLRLRLFLRKNNKQLLNNLAHDTKSSQVKEISVKVSHGDISGGQKSSIITVFNLGFQNFIDLDIPIIDHFGTIEMFFSQVKNEAGFLNTIMDNSYSTLKIPIQTIYDYIYNQNKPKKKHIQAKLKQIELKNTKSNLTIDYKGLGSYMTYCSYNNDDIFQGQEKPTQFSRDDFRMHMNRLKRIMWSVQQYTDWLKDLKNFTYPNSSIIFYAVILLFALVYDNNYMHIFGVLSIILIMIYNSPAYSIYVPQIITILNYQDRCNRINNWLHIKNQKIQEQYTKINEKLIKKAFLEQFELTRKKKRNIYKKYKRLAEILLRCQNLALLIVSICQKIKNIFVWYHYQKTKFVFLGLLSILLAFICIPFRLIIILIIIQAARKGLKYHSRVQDINRIVLTQIIRIIIEQNDYSIVRVLLNNQHKNFDLCNLETRQFMRKCRQVFLEWIDITYEEQKILKNSPNMYEFIKNVSKCKNQFLIKQQICKKYKFSLQWSKNQKSVAKVLKMIYGFIITIPSDKMIMGVKTIADQEDQQLEEKAEDVGQFLQF